MAGQFKTLDQIISQIRYRGNLAGYTSRHGTDVLRELWNESWQELREEVSFHEDGTFLTQTAPAALPTSAAITGEVYAEVDFPADAVAIYGVRVKDARRWRPLKPIPVSAIHDYQRDGLFSGFGFDDGHVRGYALRTIPVGSGTSELAGKIMLAPVPRSGEYSVWYLQAWEPLTDGTHKVSGHAAFLEWSVWDTVVKTRAKDGKRDKTFLIAVEERDRAMERIKTRAQRINEGLSMEPRDARYDGDSLYWDEA